MALPTLQRSGNRLASAQAQLQVLQNVAKLPGEPFATRLAEHDHAPLPRQALTTLQVNVGKVCNQTCAHCHVDAGPDRRESMSQKTAEQVIEFLARSQVQTLDITGGAPEMNPQFRWLVTQARRLNKRVIDRCNLTILVANGFTDLPEFLAEHDVNVVASLPCYLEENCDSQRGSGVFHKSIEGIRRLNELGYGHPHSALQLDLVYNPTGWGLPPAQKTLEKTYRTELAQRYAITFNHLFTITNLPISRFLDDLLRQEQYAPYMEKLINSFNSATIDGLMCRALISVDWEGYLYDCDFNQMLELAIQCGPERVHISQLTDELLMGHPISVSNHCYGCTAGAGSSCSGSLLL